MPPKHQQSNEPLGPKQVAIVLENISSRQEELQFIDKIIQKEQAKSAANAAAIAHLEPAITRAKLAIDAQKRALTDLRGIKLILEGPSRAPGPNWAELSEAKSLCEDAMNRVDSQLANGLEKMDGQISSIEGNIPLLYSALRGMELEISGHQLMEDASLQHITTIESHKKSIEDNIRLLRAGVNPIKNTPAEIWTRVFTLRVNEDMETYFASPTHQLISSTAVKLSHVCQFWRRIALTEGSLWQYMAIYPNSQWISSKIEFLKYLHPLNARIPTLVYDLTLPMAWTGISTPHNRHGQYTGINRTYSPIGASEISLFTKYSLRLLTYGYNGGVPLPSSTSFRQPKSVTVEIIAKAQPAYLNQVLGTLSMFTRLELVTRQNYPAIALPLSSSQSQLTYLKLDFTTFQPFDIASYLGPNLEELHIHHNGFNSLTLSTTLLRLTKLKVLGVTPPDTNFTKSLVLPKLEKIVLYGPKLIRFDRISLIPFTSGNPFHRARELELRNWPCFKSTTGESWSIMGIINEAVDKMCFIATLRCVDSYIDGSRLVSLAEKLKNTSAEVSVLETAIFDHCSGITRDNCEAIRNLVRKVEVYV